MATDAEIASAVTAAQTLNSSGTLTEQNIILLLDRAIADAIVKSSTVVSLPIAIASSDGVSVSTMTIDQAQRLRDYYKNEVRRLAGPTTLAPQFGSFDSGSYGGP